MEKPFQYTRHLWEYSSKQIMDYIETIEKKLEWLKKEIEGHSLTELYDTYLFKQDEIIISDDILEYIIDKHTNKEEGVRNLKRCIESIISKINIYYLTNNSENIDLRIINIYK